MISPWLEPSRKPPNASRGLRPKIAHFIPNAGVHTKGSYNSTTTRFCAPLKKKRRWALSLVAEPRGQRCAGDCGARVASPCGDDRGHRVAAESLEVLHQQSTSKPEVPMFSARFWKLQSPFCRNSFGLGSAIAKRINEAGLASGRSCRFTTKGYDASPRWFAPHPVRD